MNNQEIERKWLVREFPKDIEPTESWTVNQSYIYAGEDIEMRVFEKVDLLTQLPTEYHLTVKKGEGLVRTEIEINITKEEYKNFLSIIPHDPIHKTYNRYLVRGVTFEVLEVDHDWFYAEVEFDSEEAAKAFNLEDFSDFINPAEWREVTFDSKYAMKKYWSRTRSNN